MPVGLRDGASIGTPHHTGNRRTHRQGVAVLFGRYPGVEYAAVLDEGGDGRNDPAAHHYVGHNGHRRSNRPSRSVIGEGEDQSGSYSQADHCHRKRQQMPTLGCQPTSHDGAPFRGYRPWNHAWRFWLNALMPSWKSPVNPMSAMASVSASSCVARSASQLLSNRALTRPYALVGP